MKKYGLVVGRFQPFHYGHQHIINEVLLDGRIPIVCIGDDLGKDVIRNPLTFEQRIELIKRIYPNTEIIFKRIIDDVDWTKWFNQFLFICDDKDVALYYNNKEQDRYKNFTVHGKEYHNEFYTKIFEDAGIKLKQVEFVTMQDLKVYADATNIRANLEAFKHLLDARVYWKLKEWKW